MEEGQGEGEFFKLVVFSATVIDVFSDVVVHSFEVSLHTLWRFIG